MKKITTSILSAFLILIAFTSKAQIFTNYTTADGLPHNNTLCLVEDNSGNMWFGTQDGVAKFDGLSTWTVYNTSTEPLLLDDNITAIAVDASNNIWVGTDFGVSMYNGSSFTASYTTLDGLGDNRIRHIAEAPNGDIWFSDFDGATMFDGVNFIDYNMADGLPFGGVEYIDFDSNGDVYMATSLGGMVQFDGFTFTTYNTGLLSNNATSIAIDGSDNKWLGTAKGITVFDNTNTIINAHTRMYVMPAPDTLNPVVDVKINSQGAVWTGIYVDYLVTVGGIATNGFAQPWTDYDDGDGLVGPVVRRITIAANDDVWIGTSSGVSKLSFSTAVNELNFTENSFKVYPNPVKDVLNIRFEELQDTEQDIAIYNTAMQLVKQVQVSSYDQSIAISVNDLSTGMYFVKVGTQVSRVVVD